MNDSINYTITLDATQAINSMKELIIVSKKVRNELRPKWWHFWKWFRPIIININTGDPIITTNL
jgi:hypothetical protein